MTTLLALCDASQGSGMQFQPAQRCPASLLPSMLTQQHFLPPGFVLCVKSPLPSPLSTQEQDGVQMAEHSSPKSLQIPEGQETATSQFLLGSVMAPGFGQQREKNTRCCSPEMRRTFLWEMCACHIHGQFSAGDQVVTLGWSLSTPSMAENICLWSWPHFWEEVGLETSRGSSFSPSQFCDSAADNVLVKIHWSH